MSNKSKIEWTDVTWNPVTGCSKVSDGCKNCYAERMTARFRKDHKPWTLQNAQHNIKLHSDRLSLPLNWRKPRRVFVNSMSDLFHDLVPAEFILRVFLTMRNTPQHTYQILTKRPERMQWFMSEYLPAAEALADTSLQIKPPAHNVWLGVSVEDQKAADERIPLLLQTPAVVRFLSCEPLLGPVDLTCIPYSGDANYKLDVLAGRYAMTDATNGTPFSYGLSNLRRVNWVIVGGESGPDARPMNPSWARSIQEQCAAAGVPFLFKQWGEWFPREQWEHNPELVLPDDCDAYTESDKSRVLDGDTPMHRVGKTKAGRNLDGFVWDEYPGDRMAVPA